MVGKKELGFAITLDDRLDGAPNAAKGQIERGRGLRDPLP